jgi:hypothetical protein
MDNWARRIKIYAVPAHFGPTKEASRLWKPVVRIKLRVLGAEVKPIILLALEQQKEDHHA